jgi:hypothetical protein
LWKLIVKDNGIGIPMAVQHPEDGIIGDEPEPSVKPDGVASV